MTKAFRSCEQCGVKMPAGVARTPINGKLVCEGCKNGRPGRPLTGKREEVTELKWTKAEAPMARIDGHIVRIAHQSNDNTVIFHCPFCGSGQVIARSDGTTNCEFCDSTFIVQIQPQQHAMPQTINGVPYQIPGMPAGGPAQSSDNSITNPQDPNAAPVPEDAGNESFGGDDLSDKVEQDDTNVPDISKGALFVTASGMALPLEDFEEHIAIALSSNRKKTLDEVKRKRGE